MNPVVDDFRAGDRLEANDDHPVVPIQPAHGETRPTAQGITRVVSERTRRRVCGSHFAEHPHDENDEHAAEHVCHNGGGAGGSDHHTRPTKNPAPMTPPMAIMVSCRCDSPWLSCGAAMTGR